MALKTTAEARRRRFLKQKKEHGDIEQITKYYHTLPYIVWFDEKGEIMKMGKDEDKVFSKKYKSAVFNDDEVAILQNSNWGLYRVRTDDKIDIVHYIELKPIDEIITKQEEFLSEIETGSSRGADVKVSVKGKNFNVTLGPKVIKAYKDIDIDKAVVRGQNKLKFYFTTIKEPSFLRFNLNVSFKQLLDEKSVTTILPYEMDQSSIYTIKIFDKYVRI